MPAHFLDELDASNRQKKPGAPLALIFQSKHDESGAVTSLSSQYCYHQIAQTHEIAIKVIDNFNQIQPEINRVGELKRSKPSCIILHGHGSSNAIKPECADIHFSATSKYGIEELTEDDFNGIARAVPLILFSCKTASLAKYLALILDRDVSAPVENQSPDNTFFSYCQRHQRIEMSSFSEEENHVHLYCSDSQAATSSCIEKSSKEVEAEFATYLANRNPSSLEGKYLVTLGDYYTAGAHGLVQSNESGSLRYQLAAIKLKQDSDSGSKMASYHLANLYLKGHGVPKCLERAKLCFEISVLQGFAKAQEMLNILKESEQVNEKIA